MEKVNLLVGERQKNESSRAIQACNDYLRMGPGRSLAALHRQYQELPRNTTPTRSRDTLHKWAQRYNWAGRAEAYDAKIEAEKDARAREIMQTGLALEHERAQELKELYTLLKEQLYERGEDGALHNLWLPDVKQIGSGPTAERFDIERYNSALVGDMRGVLDDLAKETGGRIQSHKLDADLHIFDPYKWARNSEERFAESVAGLLELGDDQCGD